MKANIFSADLVIIPVNLHDHWSLITIDNRRKVMESFDSASIHNNILDTMTMYLQDEMRDKMKSELDMSLWTIQKRVSPKQNNGIDCGIFTCASAEMLAKDQPLLYTHFQKKKKNRL